MWVIRFLLFLLGLFEKRKPPVPPAELSPETQRRLRVLFAEPDWPEAERLLRDSCGTNLPFCEKSNPESLERLRFAAMKLSDGSLTKLDGAVSLAQSDWRDLLLAAQFGDLDTHARWEPLPASHPAHIDPDDLGEQIHQVLDRHLRSPGFTRDGNVWARMGLVNQTVGLHRGVNDRLHCVYYLEVELDCAPTPVILRLPRLEKLDEQGYRFHAGQDLEAELDRLSTDMGAVAPWLQRFTTSAEMKRGFADGTFSPHLRVEGKALLGSGATPL